MVVCKCRKVLVFHLSLSLAIDELLVKMIKQFVIVRKILALDEIQTKVRSKKIDSDRMLIVVIYIAHCSFYWISASIFVNLYMDWLDLSRRAVKTCNLLIVACFMAIEDFESWCFCMINWFVNVLACRLLSCTVLCTKSLFVENAYAFPSIVYAWYCIFLFLLSSLTILSCFSIGSQLLTVTCAKLTSVFPFVYVWIVFIGDLIVGWVIEPLFRWLHWYLYT